jgi:hypothetical protein
MAALLDDYFFGIVGRRSASANRATDVFLLFFTAHPQTENDWI